MKSRIVVVGSLNMDLVVRAPHIPKPGETVLGGEDLKAIPGGKGANQAYGAARLGADVAMVGRVGEDTFGEQLIHSLQSAAIDTTHVTVGEQNATGVAVIVVEHSGQNSIVVASGANALVTIADVKAAESVFASADLLLLQLEIPVESVLTAAQVAKSQGVKILLNPAPAQPLSSELLSLVDILVLNETEAEILCGQPIDLESATPGSHLSDLGVSTIILTLGSHGSVLIEGDHKTVVPPFSIQPVDTTAAGDSFIGSFAVAFTEGKTLLEAVRLGNAAGALTATKLGAQSSMPSREELEQFLSNTCET